MAISSLQQLIAPLTLEEFAQRLRDRTLHFQPTPDPSRFAGLLTWETLRRTIESGGFSARNLSVVRASRKIAPYFYLDKGRVQREKLSALLPQGISVVAGNLDSLLPPLDMLCRDIRARLGEAVSAGALATTGRTGAFTLHYDYPDLIILQLEGAKRWLIHTPTVAHPVEGSPMIAENLGEPVFDEWLRPGDLLLLPAGYWHHCENGPHLSLHGIIYLRPPTGLQAVGGLTPLLRDEEIFRQPLTRLNPAQRTVHEAALKARLIDKIRETPLSELLTANGWAASAPLRDG